jgi:cytochrome c-type biogenesis protein CcmH/NrfG
LQLHFYDQATESYQNALRLNPDDGQALTGLAVLALRQGQSDVALADLEHAVKSDPNDVNVLVYVQALRQVGRSAEADSAAAQVQKISQDPGQAQFDAGQLLFFAGVKPL